jgi:Protein of unknown function (DUF433)
VTFERITTDLAVMGGLPCIRGLRFPVATVVAMVADGMTTDEILAEHPDLFGGLLARSGATSPSVLLILGVSVSRSRVACWQISCRPGRRLYSGWEHAGSSSVRLEYYVLRPGE